MVWKSGARQNELQGLLDEVLPDVDSSGMTYTGMNQFILYELAAATANQISDTDVLKVLKRMHEEGRDTVEGFAESRREIVEESASGGRPVKWKFFLPVEMDLSDELSKPIRLHVLGFSFYFRTDDSVSREWDGADLRQKIMENGVGMRISELPDTYVSCIGEGTDWEDAFHGVGSAFDAMRGLLEFVTSFGSWRLMGGPKPRGKVPHPKYVLSNSSEDEIQARYFHRLDPERLDTFEIEPKHRKSFNALAESMKSRPESGSIAELLGTVMRLYSQAMDAHLNHQAFLSLWQLAEAITLSETRHGKTTAVRKRLQWHAQRLEFPGSGFRHILQRFAAKRNDIVHRGIHDVWPDDINLLKTICEMATGWLVDRADRLQSKHHLDEFYRLRTTSPTELDAMEDVIHFVREQRNQRG